MRVRSVAGQKFGRKGKPDKAGGIRPAFVYGLFGLLCFSNAVSAVALLMSPDIAALLNNGESEIVAAYENRINELRVEVDRLHSRQYAQAGDVNLQLQEIAQQQEVLFEQQQYVRALAQKAAELGIEAASVEPEESFATGAVASGSTNIEETGAKVRKMLDETRLALGSIFRSADEKTARILDELGQIGIHPDMPQTDAVGGPFIPADATGAPNSDEIYDNANVVFDALIRFKAARRAADSAPIHRPLSGYGALSSSYGNRKDPFTGRMAFHSGLDFPAPSGTLVMSAADGEVTFVGQKAGYGKAVEITHSNGYVTRYGHLSAFLAHEGQKVKTGTPIGKVGSTGRSTGPHLHFEVRKTDRPLDPNRFLRAGRRLRAVLQAAG